MVGGAVARLGQTWHRPRVWAGHRLDVQASCWRALERRPHQPRRHDWFRVGGAIPAETSRRYVAAQCIGAIAASYLLGWFSGRSETLASRCPKLPIARAFVVEMGFSGLLGFVIMGGH